MLNKELKGTNEKISNIKIPTLPDLTIFYNKEEITDKLKLYYTKEETYNKDEINARMHRNKS